MNPLERDVLPGQTLGGKYQLRRVLGSGGMGTVYEVEHLLTHQRGALKLLRREYARIEPVVRRFLREASAAGRIGSPHIVQTYDAGELDTGQPYIFMELLEGEPLRGLLDRRGRLTFDEACTLVAQAAAGLGAAHAAGIVHRDIKPDNLFVCAGVRPFVKILDFGISKFRLADGEAAVTRDGEMIGTPLYMAPEQVTGEHDVDPRLDVYALGVVLYEMLTGQVPHRADNLAALAQCILAGVRTPASDLLPDAPPGLDAFFDAVLAVDPRQRLPDMAAFVAGLEAVHGHLETFVGPADSHASLQTAPASSSGSVPAERSATRRRTRAGTWFGLAALAAAGGLALTWAIARRSDHAGAGVGAASVAGPRGTGSDDAPKLRSSAATESRRPAGAAGPVDRATGSPDASGFVGPTTGSPDASRSISPATGSPDAAGSMGPASSVRAGAAHPTEPASGSSAGVSDAAPALAVESEARPAPGKIGASYAGGRAGRPPSGSSAPLGEPPGAGGTSAEEAAQAPRRADLPASNARPRRRASPPPTAPAGSPETPAQQRGLSERNPFEAGSDA